MSFFKRKIALTFVHLPLKIFFFFLSLVSFMLIGPENYRDMSETWLGHDCSLEIVILMGKVIETATGIMLIITSLHF